MNTRHVLKSSLALASAALTSALVATSVLWRVHESHAEAEYAVRQSQQTVERLRRRLEAVDGRTSDRTLPRAIGIAAANDAEAEFELQKRVMELTDANGIVPLAFGPALLPDAGGANAIAFEIELEASFDAVLDLLKEVELLDPPVAIQAMTIRQVTGRTQSEVTPVYTRLVFWSLWVPASGGA